MQDRRVKSSGRHRAPRSPRQRRRAVRVKATVSAVGAAGVAVVGATVIGVAPTLAVSPQLMATLHYLRGTNIGSEPTEQQYEDFIGVVLDGTGTIPPDEPYEKVPYNAGFWPFSHGGFGDLTYNASVRQGVELLEAQQPAAGDIIFGFSQGAVAASKYKGEHTGNTYALVGNPSRPNGGVMERFRGWGIPFVNVTFSGATPNNGDLTIDVTRQYDGWADFPTYLWNPVAITNAFMGIQLVHGNTQTELTVADLELAQASGSDYYQHDPDSNTTYYMIRTYPVPLLMPLQAILPDSIIAALDEPLRWFIETAYDRTDYGAPTRATLFEPFNFFDQDDDLTTTTVAAEDLPAATTPPVDVGIGAPEEPDEPSGEPGRHQIERLAAEDTAQDNLRLNLIDPQEITTEDDDEDDDEAEDPTATEGAGAVGETVSEPEGPALKRADDTDEPAGNDNESTDTAG